MELQDTFSSIFSLAALAILVFTVIRGRRRIRCLENKMSLQKNVSKDARASAEKSYNENNLVKLVDVCRELEARVQNRAHLLEELLEQVDAKLALVGEGGGVQQRSRVSSQVSPICQQVISLSREGKNDYEIGRVLNRSEGEIKLLRSLGNHSNSSD